MKSIEILPAEGGWMVRSDAIANPLFFRSGASAESAAVRLAQGWADAGEDARVEIHLRDGSLARRFTVPSLRLDLDTLPAPFDTGALARRGRAEALGAESAQQAPGLKGPLHRKAANQNCEAVG